MGLFPKITFWRDQELDKTYQFNDEEGTVQEMDYTKPLLQTKLPDNPHISVTVGAAYIGPEIKEGWLRVRCIRCGSGGQVHPDLLSHAHDINPDQEIVGLCGDCQMEIEPS